MVYQSRRRLGFRSSGSPCRLGAVNVRILNHAKTECVKNS
jgi:hypothetical protein